MKVRSTDAVIFLEKGEGQRGGWRVRRVVFFRIGKRYGREENVWSEWKEVVQKVVVSRTWGLQLRKRMRARTQVVQEKKEVVYKLAGGLLAWQ